MYIIRLAIGMGIRYQGEGFYFKDGWSWQLQSSFIATALPEFPFQAEESNRKKYWRNGKGECKGGLQGGMEVRT